MHSWNVTPKQAKAIQEDLRNKVILGDQFDKLKHVAGVDVGFEDNGKITRAAVVILGFPDLVLIEQSIARTSTTFPYVPGLLSFREVPAVLDAYKGLCNEPDILLCDGQGIAHPRRFGIACHLGVILNKPTIGVAKSRLIGKHTVVPYAKGSSVPLIDNNKTIGAVVRTRNNVKPLFISPGHKITLNSSIEIVMQCLTHYRLPETTRFADRIASRGFARYTDS